MAEVYPRAATSRVGNWSSVALSSCRHSTSGCARASQSSKRCWRMRTELMFQLAIFISDGSLADLYSECLRSRPADCPHFMSSIDDRFPTQAVPVSTEPQSEGRVSVAKEHKKGGGLAWELLH